MKVNADMRDVAAVKRRLLTVRLIDGFNFQLLNSSFKLQYETAPATSGNIVL